MIGVRDVPELPVKLTPALAAQLAVLTAALDDPDVDLDAAVRHLGVSAQAAVESFLGLSLTLAVEGYPFTISAPDATLDAATAVRASLRIPVSTRAGTQPGTIVVFYAATRGAFVDLAADITHARAGSVGAVVLDEDLQVPPPGGGPAELSAIHQAVGVLIARGDNPHLARSELERRASRCGVDLVTAAADVLASTGPSSPSRP